MGHVPSSHPRAASLRVRERLVCGFEDGLVAKEGLIAHGRGEAFDYIIGERTGRLARRSISAAAAMLLLAERPVVSVNGNVAALCPREAIRLARAAGAALEVNLFYDSAARRRRIAARLGRLGARGVLGADGVRLAALAGLDSARRMVDRGGIARADVVLVSLEDGDRTEALVRGGARVIAIDLNPLSRTARRADVTIVDNVVRAMGALAARCAELRGAPRSRLARTAGSYENGRVLAGHIAEISTHLGRMARSAGVGR